jgi:hypothetical protein
MTSVTDTAVFAAEVVGNDALPFLALALMRAAEVGTLLEETRKALGDKPWSGYPGLRSSVSSTSKLENQFRNPS